MEFLKLFLQNILEKRHNHPFQIQILVFFIRKINELKIANIILQIDIIMFFIKR